MRILVAITSSHIKEEKTMSGLIIREFSAEVESINAGLKTIGIDMLSSGTAASVVLIIGTIVINVALLWGMFTLAKRLNRWLRATNERNRELNSAKLSLELEKISLERDKIKLEKTRTELERRTTELNIDLASDPDLKKIRIKLEETRLLAEIAATIAGTTEHS